MILNSKSIVQYVFVSVECKNVSEDVIFLLKMSVGLFTAVADFTRAEISVVA